MKELAFKILDDKFNSPYAHSWGTKGYLLDVLRASLKITLKQAKQFFEEWVVKNS